MASGRPPRLPPRPGAVAVRAATGHRLEAPGAIATHAMAISPTGVIAGYHVDEHSVSHGFVAEPLNPTGW